MSDSRGPLAMLGGAFDPVHYGHLRTAYELHAALRLEEIRFVPSANPPHRDGHIATGEQRMQMLESALDGLSWARADDIELQRDGPSWSVLTLADMRAVAGDRSLCMIIGMDAFLGLADWHRWEELGELAHLVVAHRPGWVPPEQGVLGDLLHRRQTDDAQALHEAAAGHIYVHEVTQLDIASSAIRAGIKVGLAPSYLVPEPVNEIIRASGCYGRLQNY
jgi:nicotinate-nucleotide adenylyltransferase